MCHFADTGPSHGTSTSSSLATPSCPQHAPITGTITRVISGNFRDLTDRGAILVDGANKQLQGLLEGRRPEPQKFTLPDGGHLVITQQHYYDPMTQIQHYTRHLTFLHPGGQREEKTLRTALRYVYPQEMEALLFYNGFQIRSCYGNWQQDPLTASSPSMIYVCQRRV